MRSLNGNETQRFVSQENLFPFLFPALPENLTGSSAEKSRSTGTATAVRRGVGGVTGHASFLRFSKCAPQQAPPTTADCGAVVGGLHPKAAPHPNPHLWRFIFRGALGILVYSERTSAAPPLIRVAHSLAPLARKARLSPPPTPGPSEDVPDRTCPPPPKPLAPAAGV